jgi:uncharacterized protein YjiS (DUF1127 family)
MHQIVKERSMMTQPIQKFQQLASEARPAGGNDLIKLGFGYDDRRVFEKRARYERAAMLANVLTDALLWAGRLCKRAVEAIRTSVKLRAAEDQLMAMSDRELADLGLCRAEIPFAIRQVSGMTPEIDGPAIAGAAANQNLRRAA